MAQDIVVAADIARLIKGMATNATASSFSALLATATKPAASSTRTVIDRGKGPSRCVIRVIPFAVATNNQTMSVKVVGWHMSRKDSITPVPLWVANTICLVACTMSSTLVGVAGADVVTTELFADTLSLTNGTAVLDQGTADVDTASFIADVSGYELVEIIPIIGSSTSANTLYRLY